MLKLKLDEKGQVVVQNGMPVYVDDSTGKEQAIDVPNTVITVARLTSEAKAHRERAETAEAKLDTFKGIEDPAAAVKALMTVKNLDDKKLIDAGKAEEIKSEAIKATKAQYEPVVSERDKLQAQLNKAVIGGSFSRSKFITEKMAVPPDIVEAMFSNAFTLDGERIVAKDRSGNIIYSPSRPGEYADFDEALSALVNNYANKDSILKSTTGSGSGTTQDGQRQSNNNNNGNGQKQMKRADFAKLPPLEQAGAAKTHVIVD